MLDVADLTVRYGDVLAVDDVTLHVDADEVVCVLGPSGCGKSSLLRAVAGLEPMAGRVQLNGHDITAVRPDRRGISLMFQEQALFPHRDVAANVAFGPRMRGWAPDDITTRVDEVLTLVGLQGHAHRSVDELSGGERQRVALARALAPRPHLLMLDEPMGSLDRALRDQLVRELPAVFAESGAAVLYVTHDQDEALALADRVVVMRAGRVVQDAPPAEAWRRPADAFVAHFLGLRNLLEGELRADGAHTPLGVFPADATPPRGRATVVLLPEAVTLVSTDGYPGVVTARSFAGDHFLLDIRTDAGVALAVPLTTARLPSPGDRVRVAIDRDAAVVLPDDGTSTTGGASSAACPGT